MKKDSHDTSLEAEKRKEQEAIIARLILKQVVSIYGKLPQIFQDRPDAFGFPLQPAIDAMIQRIGQSNQYDIVRASSPDTEYFINGGHKYEQYRGVCIKDHDPQQDETQLQVFVQSGIGYISHETGRNIVVAFPHSKEIHDDESRRRVKLTLINTRIVAPDNKERHKITLSASMIRGSLLVRQLRNNDLYYEIKPRQQGVLKSGPDESLYREVPYLRNNLEDLHALVRSWANNFDPDLQKR